MPCLHFLFTFGEIPIALRLSRRGATLFATAQGCLKCLQCAQAEGQHPPRARTSRCLIRPIRSAQKWLGPEGNGHILDGINRPACQARGILHPPSNFALGKGNKVGPAFARHDGGGGASDGSTRPQRLGGDGTAAGVSAVAGGCSDACDSRAACSSRTVSGCPLVDCPPSGRAVSRKRRSLGSGVAAGGSAVSGFLIAPLSRAGDDFFSARQRLGGPGESGGAGNGTGCLRTDCSIAAALGAASR